MSRTSKQHSLAQERGAAARLGGRATPGSGATWSAKNDVRTPDFSLEYKWTGAASFSLRHADLALAERYAILDGRTMAFGISYAAKGNYVVLTQDDFEMLKDAAGWR